MGDLSGLVVAAQDGDSVSITHFQGNEQRYCLHRVVTSIDVVSHKQVVGVWGLASNFEKFLKVVELAMDVAANRDGSAYLRHI